MQLHISPFYGTDFTNSSVSTSAWSDYGSATRFPDYAQNWGASTGATWEITGVQLEVGSVATDFEHRSYGEELSLCQRYFNKLQSAFVCTAASGFVFNLQFPVTMRAAPSQSHSYGGVANDVYRLANAATPTFVPNGIFTDTHNLRSGYDHDGGFTVGEGYVTDWEFDAEL